MYRLSLFLLLGLLLAGCASRWEHATKRPSEFYADDQDCQQIAGSASMAVDPLKERTSYESCMWERGWRKKNTIWFFDPAGK